MIILRSKQKTYSVLGPGLQRTLNARVQNLRQGGLKAREVQRSGRQWDIYRNKVDVMSQKSGIEANKISEGFVREPSYPWGQKMGYKSYEGKTQLPTWSAMKGNEAQMAKTAVVNKSAYDVNAKRVADSIDFKYRGYN